MAHIEYERERKTVRIDGGILEGIEEVIEYHNQMNFNAYVNMLIKQDVKKLRTAGEVTH